MTDRGERGRFVEPGECEETDVKLLSCVVGEKKAKLPHN